MWGLALSLKETETEIYIYYIITDDWKKRIWNITIKKSFYIFSRIDNCNY